MGALDPGLDRLREDLVAEIRASEARTAQRIGALDTRLGALDTRLGALDTRLGALDTRVGDLDTRVGALDTRVGALDTRVGALDTRVGGLATETGLRFEAIEARIDAAAAETRRHFDVIAEALRSDIVVVIEGLAALDEKAERFQSEVRGEFVKVDRRFLHLEARVISALERR